MPRQTTKTTQKATETTAATDAVMLRQPAEIKYREELDYLISID